MNWRILLAIVASGFTLAFTAAPASAQATRTWVASNGNDSNACTRAAPCATFPGAMGKTIAGGEINCVDAGGYGTLTITQSITIDCQGTFGSTLATGGSSGMVVNNAGAIVILRNLSITGGTPGSPGTNGVRVIAAAQVNIENVRIQNFRTSSTPVGFGIFVAPAAGTVTVVVDNSIITNNGSGFFGAGIGVAPTGSAAVVMFVDNSDINTNASGILFDAGNTTSSANALTVRRSRLAANTIVAMQTLTGANTLSVMLDGVVMEGNGVGISMGGAGLNMRIGRSVATRNNSFLSQTTGTILSFKTNQIQLNGNNNTPLNPVLQQ